MNAEVIRLVEQEGIPREEVEAAVASIAEREAQAEAWGPPLPFEEVPTMQFPVESLPGCLCAFVECLAEATQTTEEMAGVLSLGVLAAVFQSRYTVQITPDWAEQLSLYTVAVAPPAERKSAVLAPLTQPLIEWEAERREEEAAEIEQNRLEREYLEREKSAATNAAARGRDKQTRDERKAEIMRLAEQLAAFKDRYPYRLIVDDTTPEKLVDLIEQQNGCIAVCSAEGGVFDSMAGRYDKSANFDVYLKGHAGDRITVDRVGRKGNCIKKPRLTMILAVQPDVLGGLMNNATFRGRGLCGRFLYAVCKSKVGTRKITPAPIPDQVKNEYRAFIRRALDSKWTGVIRLSLEADELRQQYQACIEKRLGDKWDAMQDWGGKLVGAMLRIAALFHAAEEQGDPTQTPIPPERMVAAINVAEFLSTHAEAAYQMMGADTSAESAKYILKRIRTNGKESVPAAELNALCHGKLSSRDRRPALDMLIERGYIREAVEPIDYNGRTKTVYHVNPTVFT